MSRTPGPWPLGSSKLPWMRLREWQSFPWVHVQILTVCAENVHPGSSQNSCHPMFTVVYNNPAPCSTIYNKLTELQGYSSFLTGEPNPPDPSLFSAVCLLLFTPLQWRYPLRFPIHVSLLYTCLLLLVIWQGLWTHAALRNPTTYKCYFLYKISEVNVEKHPFVGSCLLFLPIGDLE